jgi:hypothetical protein
MHDQEQTAIQTLSSISGLLSVFGCAVVLSKFIGKKSRKSNWNLSNAHAAVLSSIDLITAVFWSIGFAGTKNEGFCQFQVKCIAYIFPII